MRDKLIDFICKKTKLEKEKIENFLETPQDVKFGDYAFPCFILTKQLKKPPIEIALELRRDLEKNLPDFLERIENKGPYLNFFVDKKMLAQEVLSKALEKNYGAQKQKKKNLI